MTTALNRITYVEDESDVRAIVLLSLERIGGYVVDACPTGYDALERAPDFNPDLILLDMMMPGMDGEDTLRALKEMPQFRKTPFAFMTAKALTGEMDHYFELGACGVIAKPFDPITLPQRLHVIWRHYHQP